MLRLQLGLATVLMALTPMGGAADDLEDGFRNPPIDARPRGLWTWLNGNFDETEIWREIQLAGRNGMGGFDIWDAPSFGKDEDFMPVGPAVVSDEFLAGVGTAVEAARETGFKLGFIWNQSVSFPDPEHSHMALFHTKVEVSGPGKQKLTLPFPEIEPNKRFGYRMMERDAEGRPSHWDHVAVLAFPAGETVAPGQIVDLTGKVGGDTLEWEVPPGEWTILRLLWSRTTETGLTPTPATLKPPVDFLNPEATEIHLTWLLEKMEKHTGPLRDSPIQYFCADSYEFKGIWTPKLPEIFLQESGYDLTPFLPALAGYTVDDKKTTDAFLFDFRNLISNLVIENHYAKATEVCKKFGIGFTAEAAGPGPPVHEDVPMETIRSSGVLSFPRGEFWVHDRGPRENLQIVKGIASAAHLYGQPYVTAEAFTGVHLWNYGPGDLKPYSDRAFAEGLNRIDFHTFPHTPLEAGLPGWSYGFANLIGENLIWWPKSRGFMDYLARSSFMLQQGHFVGDALYYHGEEAPFFAEPKHIKEGLGFGYDYDIANADILLNRLSVQDGRLTLPHGQTYRILVLPERDSMSLSILEKIQALLEEGATVIGPKPQSAPGLHNQPTTSEAIQKLAEEIWGPVDGKSKTRRRVGKGTLVWGESPRKVLLSHEVGPDVTVQGAKLDFIHRRLGNAEFYYIRNPEPQPVAVSVEFRVPGKQPEIWDPVTGEMTPLTIYRSSKTGTTVPFSLAPHESCFVVLRTKAENGAALQLDGKPVFPTDNVPESWPFLETRGGIQLLKAGRFELSGPQETVTTNGDSPTHLLVHSEWKLRFRDPWNERFSTTSDLKSWTEFEDYRIKYFSGTGTYENSFTLPPVSFRGNKRIILDLGRVEEAAEVFVNGRSSGLVWTQPARIDITDVATAGQNRLTIEVVNRWPNRLIGDAKLPPEKRQARSGHISTLPSAWAMPLENLPNKSYPLPDSGLLGPVTLEVMDVLPQHPRNDLY